MADFRWLANKRPLIGSGKSPARSKQKHLHLFLMIRKARLENLRVCSHTLFEMNRELAVEIRTLGGGYENVRPYVQTSYSASNVSSIEFQEAHDEARGLDPEAGLVLEPENCWHPSPFEGVGPCILSDGHPGDHVGRTWPKDQGEEYSWSSSMNGLTK